MNRLTELANKYGTDKGTEGRIDLPDLDGHYFTEFYDEYYSQLIGTHPVLLEIGVWLGSSIKMVNEYFSGDCEIYCIDIDENFYENIKDLGDNIHFYKLDQGNEEELNNFKNEMENNDIKFDIILDDGSHRINHQMLTYFVFRKLLKSTGIYIIEDLHTNLKNNDYGVSVENNRYYTTALDFFINIKPYEGFSQETNMQLFDEIDYVKLFLKNHMNNAKDLGYSNDIRTQHNYKSLSAIIKLNQ